MATAAQVIDRLESYANPVNVAGMARFGINPENTLGISMPILRKLAKEIGKDHDLAAAIWNTKVHEARILAALIDVPSEVTEEQMEAWAAEFDSWDLCDQVVMNLFTYSSLSWKKALQWSSAEAEFVKRAGFAIMATLAVKDKRSSDDKFLPFLDAIEREAGDERNFVKKAVNWALRQIGKRNLSLNQKAVETSQLLAAMQSKAARRNGSSALSELTGEAVRSRLAKRES